MNYIEDEPRKVPKPVPFSQNSPLHPAVPEVSLILQETKQLPSTPTGNSFSGTEFQTYNAWRWKNMNEREKENLNRQSLSNNKKRDFYPINDKFSGSDIEKRKNELLYGNPDEPRRPLPPRPVPVIPKCLAASFSDASFTNEPWINDKSKDDEGLTAKKNTFNTDNYMSSKNELKRSDNTLIKESDNTREVYQIISEQNRNMVFLQKQIEQLLKSQDNKEKQIEQLLKSQESKEWKIEQLLKMQDMKENQIEQLLRAQEKHERQIEQLITSQENKEKELNELTKRLKNGVTAGVMAKVESAEKSTSTDFECFCTKDIYRKSNEKKAFSFENSVDGTRFATLDQSITLHSLDLPVIPEINPTPQSSIHVDIPEYNRSSDDESDTSSSEGREVNIRSVHESKPLGYTFYNNLLTQVNDIIHSHDDKETGMKSKVRECEFNSEKLKRAYLRELDSRMLESPRHIGKSSYEKLWEIDTYEQAYTNSLQGPKKSSSDMKQETDPILQSKFNNMGKDAQSPSDISLRMNALALKYLKEEHIAQYEIQPQMFQSKQPDVTIYNVTNLSFGTMRYLERCRTTSGENALSNEGNVLHQKYLQHKAKEIEY